jgi:hypothetical protein
MQVQSVFQYHTGPIKSDGAGPGPGLHYPASFNTTLVQLKDR